MLRIHSGRRIAIALTLAAACALAGDGLARAQGGGEGAVIDISKPGRSKYPIAIVQSGDKGSAAEVHTVASFDLSVAGWFKVVAPDTFRHLRSEGMTIDPEKWKDVGAYGVIKYTVSGSSISFKLFEVEKGPNPVLEKTYQASGKQVRYAVHKWCNAVVKHYTGEDGFFGSRILYTAKAKSKKGKRYSQIVSMDFDGYAAGSVTRNEYINILGAYGPGGKILYTSYMRNNPDLYVSTGGRPKQVSKYRGMNTGGSFSPDGSKIALTLSKDGNPEIYLIDASSGKIIRRLTNNRHIDTSPEFSPDGGQIAFVSDREGGPQIFVMSASGGGARRVSMNGSNNTTPTWSPQKGKSILAYTTLDGGHSDIVTLDLGTGSMKRITQGEGNNEEPSFAPNGRAIAFARLSGPGGSGVYLANADGSGDAVQVKKGAVTSIDWGGMPAQD